MFNKNLMLFRLHLKFLTNLVIHICMLNFSLFPPFSQCHIVSICVISLVVCEQLLWCVRRLRHLEIFLRKCNALLALLLLLLLSAITYLPANLTIPVLSPPTPFTSWHSRSLSFSLTHAIRETADRLAAEASASTSTSTSSSASTRLVGIILHHLVCQCTAASSLLFLFQLLLLLLLLPHVSHCVVHTKLVIVIVIMIQSVLLLLCLRYLSFLTHCVGNKSLAFLSCHAQFWMPSALCPLPLALLLLLLSLGKPFPFPTKYMAPD